MAEVTLTTNDLITRSYMENGKGTIHMAMEGGTFKSNDGISGRINNILAMGLEVTIDNDDPLSSYSINLDKFVRLCIDDYKLRKGIK